jgi:hypothetical protein
MQNIFTRNYYKMNKKGSPAVFNEEQKTHREGSGGLKENLLR